jgi:hypothetical protein
MKQRSSREVLEDHLRLAEEGKLEEDLARNYAEDLVLLCTDGVLRGLEAARASAKSLEAQLPHARFEYRTVLVDGESGFLEWRATSDSCRVEDGVDSYLIRDGRIRVQTIHYTLLPAADLPAHE